VTLMLIEHKGKRKQALYKEYKDKWHYQASGGNECRNGTLC